MAEVNPIQIAELRLLRNLWANPNLLDSQEYSDDLFCSVFCKTISKAIDTLTKNGTPLTTDALYMESARNDSSITRDLVKSITESTAESGEYITDIVKVLKDYKRTTSALDHLDHIKDVLSKNNVLTPEITQELRENFDAAEEQVLRNDEDSVKRIMDLKEWGDQWQEDFKLRTNGKRYYFSEPVLDELVVDGPAPGTGGLLVAQSGMGKSTMVLKLVNGFINAGIPCMFFSLEMGSIATYDRLLANRLQIPYTEIVNPPDAETYQAIYDQVQQERQFLDNNKLFRFCEDANVSISELKKAIIKFQEQIGQKYCIVVLDLITMIQDFVTTKSGLGMPQTIELAINKMNALSKELGIHYIGTAQLNRAGESTAVTDPEDVLRFRPSRHQVKNSSALLERCRYVVSLFRKKYYLEQYFGDDEEIMDCEDIVELQILKQNNGKTPRRCELFDGSTFSMTYKPDDENSGDFDD
jgi:replicative DNA helicase